MKSLDQAELDKLYQKVIEQSLTSKLEAKLQSDYYFKNNPENSIPIP